jgi:beta-lactamase class A
MTAPERLRTVLASAQADAALHAVDLDDPSAELGLDADRTVVLSSVFKVPLALALLRAADRGELDLRERLRLGASRTRGSPGLAALRDPVTMSLHDLACLAITVSDVAAADALYDRIGGDEPINAELRQLGLERTTIRGCCRDLFRAIIGDAPPADPAAVGRLHAPDIDRVSSSVPRELTRLLSAIWRDEAASTESCATLRSFLASQALRPRIAAGFADGDWLTATKSGTLPGIRNDIGVVESQTGRRFAVAVCLRDRRAAPPGPADEALLGRLARMAVDAIAHDPAHP